MLKTEFFQPQKIHQQLVDQARPWRKEHLPGQGADEGGKHEGDHKQQLHRLFEGQIGSRHEPGKEDPDHRAEEGDPNGNDDRILQGLIGIRLA